MNNLKVGDGILYNDFWQGKSRAVIVEIQTHETTNCPGFLLDFQELDRNNQKKPDRLWIIRETGSNCSTDPNGPFAQLKPFVCTNKNCHYHHNKGVTALPVCPNCHSLMEYQE